MCILPCAVTAVQGRQLRFCQSSSWPARRARLYSRMGNSGTLIQALSCHMHK